MIETLCLGAAVWWGVDLRRIALLVGSLWYPAVFAGLVLVRWWRARPPAGMAASRFCETVAAELRAGASIRNGIAEAALAHDAPDLSALARSDASISALAAAAGVEYPDVGAELVACIERSALLGAPAADLFEELGSVAMARSEVALEVNTAMAPARATLLVLLAVPAVAVWVAAGHGGFGAFVESGLQRLAVTAGVFLCLLAGALGALMLRRVR
jgi:hypothetical protein